MKKQHVQAALKAAAAIGVLTVVLFKVPLADLGARLRRIDGADLALLVVVTTLQVAVGVVRWWRLLARLGERVPFAALFGDVLVGLAYNLFLPTAIGGDVIRAFRASRRVSRAHRAWSSSIFERIAGLLAMASSGAVAALFAVGSLVAVPSSIRWLAVGVALVMLVVFLGASTPFKLLLGLLERRLPAPAAIEIRGISSDLEGPLARASARVEALAWSLLYQAFGVVFVIVGARALGAPGHALAIAVGVPLVHVLSMIPITLGGHGLREGLFVGILGQLGIASDVALGLAMQWLASSAMFAIAGAIVGLRTSRERAATASGEQERGAH